MSKARALAYLNGRLLAAYSRRTVGILRMSPPLRLALPHLEPVLAVNVAKEAHKDALVIRCVAEAGTGSTPPDGALRALLEQTKSIDREFLGRAGALPVRIVLDYERIGPVRMERMQLLFQAVSRLFAAWTDSASLRAAVRSSYTQQELEALLHRDLRLYAHEVRAIGDGVRLPALLAPLRRHAAERLFEVMSGEGARLAREIAAALHAPARRCVRTADERGRPPS